jgi:hypothetical protein
LIFVLNQLRSLANGELGSGLRLGRSSQGPDLESAPTTDDMQRNASPITRVEGTTWIDRPIPSPPATDETQQNHAMKHDVQDPDRVGQEMVMKGDMKKERIDDLERIYLAKWRD